MAAQGMKGVLRGAVRLPKQVLEFSKSATTEDRTGATPKEVVWTYRKTTLYRYRSTKRRHAVTDPSGGRADQSPDIFDLRPGKLLRGISAGGGIRRLSRRMGHRR